MSASDIISTHGLATTESDLNPIDNLWDVLEKTLRSGPTLQINTRFRKNIYATLDNTCCDIAEAYRNDVTANACCNQSKRWSNEILEYVTFFFGRAVYLL